MARTKLIAISGASGLLGKSFIAMLNPDIEVVHKLSFSTIKIDDIVNQIKISAESGAEYFLHLGWPASTTGDNYRISPKNFEALEKTLVAKRACNQFGISFIGLGTALDRFPFSDNTYSLTKYVTREVFLNDIKSGNITWLRPFFVFDNSYWPRFIHAEKEGPIEINDDAPRDYIYLNDVIRGIESVIRLDIKGEVDLGSQILRSPSELCSALGKQFYIKPSVSDKNETVFYIAELNEKLSSAWCAWETLKIFKE